MKNGYLLRHDNLLFSTFNNHRSMVTFQSLNDGKFCHYTLNKYKKGWCNSLNCYKLFNFTY